MHAVTFDEAKDQLPNLVEEAIRGEEVILLKGDQPVVRLVPLIPVPARPRFGSAKGLVTMSEDFDEPLDDFAAYMP